MFVEPIEGKRYKITFPDDEREASERVALAEACHESIVDLVASGEVMNDSRVLSDVILPLAKVASSVTAGCEVIEVNHRGLEHIGHALGRFIEAGALLELSYGLVIDHIPSADGLMERKIHLRSVASKMLLEAQLRLTQNDAAT